MGKVKTRNLFWAGILAIVMIIGALFGLAACGGGKVSHAVTLDYGITADFFDDVVEDKHIEDQETIKSLPTIKQDKAYTEAFAGWYVLGTDVRVTEDYVISKDITIQARFNIDEIPSGLYQNGELDYTWSQFVGAYWSAFLTEGKISSDSSSDSYFTSISGDLIVDDSITVIGSSAFKNCSNLTSITLPEGVLEIENSAFFSCTNLKKLIIPSSVEEIGYDILDNTHLQYNEYDNALYLGNMNNPYLVLINEKNADVTRCDIHHSTKFIYDDAFRFGPIESVIIPENVVSIGSGVFLGCGHLNSIVIPVSVKSVGDYTFALCDKLTKIYYGGSESDWAGVSTGAGGIPSGTLYFYSETNPGSGNFWHYVNGVPTVW